MYTLEDFHEQLVQGVYGSAECTGVLRAEAFLSEVSAYLIDEADLTENVQFAEYRNVNLGLEIHGYDFDEERGILTLIVHEFSQNDKLTNIGRSLLDAKFKRLKKFFSRALSGLYKDLEESSSAFEMAYFIYSNSNLFKTIRLFLITDCKIAMRTEAEFVSEKILNDYTIEHHVFDIDYLYKIFLSKSTNKDYNIDVKGILGHPLQCLKADMENSNYDSYLIVAPGKLLYEIYELYGQKLLEQNVRTFLQFKGKVNKGLKITIQKNPEMFFAYNNGITATAKDIVFTGNNEIGLIKGLQIVNGGQTTSAIYAAHRDKTPLDNVYVQVKLSVLKNEEMQDNFVSKISEYANTQNKVSKSDFFSNSPFHKDFKEHSEKIYAPAKQSTFYKTKWFYERARGQYLQSIALLPNKTAQNQFRKEHPKQQVIEKPMLAKSELSWKMHPDIVAKGAETCFAYFANNITNEIEKDENYITEYYFKSAVSKIIIFKETEKIVSNAKWYDGGYRAQCVTYTIALLSYIFNSNNKHFNFLSIWEKQEINIVLHQFIASLAEQVYEQLTIHVPAAVNIGQFCKKRECWDGVKKLAEQFNNIDLISSLSTDKEEIRVIKREAKNNQEIDNSIKMQEFILKQKKEIWNIIYNNEIKYNHPLRLSNTEFGVLQSMKDGKISLPTPLQAKTLYNVYTKAEKLGISV